MSKTISAATDRPYGVKRVFDTLDMPRSSFYDRKKRKKLIKGEKKKTGPTPAVSDGELLLLIRQDISSSPFTGEGHRKVWARLKFGRGIRVSRKRVLRIMRENNLLSPYRHPPKPVCEHDGEIITDKPNVMWGTDGTKVFTLKEGWAWVFTCVEHWNAEVMGWHVCKKGDRFAALEPMSMAIMDEFGTVEKGAARGLLLRMDHGTQYLSDHFQNQVRAWGMTTSFAFLEQPQTNGVAERFFRTLKEQVIYGRAFNSIDELRQAVSDFVDLYNDQWLIGKNGYKSPLQLREDYFKKEAA